MRNNKGLDIKEDGIYWATNDNLKLPFRIKGGHSCIVLSINKKRKKLE